MLHEFVGSEELVLGLCGVLLGTNSSSRARSTVLSSLSGLNRVTLALVSSNRPLIKLATRYGSQSLVFPHSAVLVALQIFQSTTIPICLNNLKSLITASSNLGVK